MASDGFQILELPLYIIYYASALTGVISMYFNLKICCSTITLFERNFINFKNIYSEIIKLIKSCETGSILSGYINNFSKQVSYSVE